MSIIGKKPFLEEILDSMSEQQISALKGLVDNLGTPTQLDFLGVGIPISFKGVRYVNTDILGLNNRTYGILCYTDTECALFTFQNDFKEMQEYKIDASNGTYVYVDENLTASEFRSEIDDWLEVKAGGDITAHGILKHMTGANGVSIELGDSNDTTQAGKVVASLDMTEAVAGSFMKAVSDGADGTKSQWGELNKSDISGAGGVVIPTATLTGKELIGVDAPRAANEQIRVQLGNGVSIDETTDSHTLNINAVKILTEAPTEANTTGHIKFVYLTAEPATKYDGYLYIIES